MIFQLNIAALAVAGRAVWKQARPIVVRDVVLLPAAGFLGIIILWWAIKFRLHPQPVLPKRARRFRHRLVTPGKFTTGFNRIFAGCCCGNSGWFSHRYVQTSNDGTQSYHSDF